MNLENVISEMLRLDIPLPEAKQMFERAYVKAALRESRGNVTEAAQRIGIHRNTVHLIERRNRR